MSIDWSFRDYFNLSKKIPLHYQKRSRANHSNGSFNASVLAGLYRNKIKKLMENNKLLALALQNDRAQKEELLAESKANANFILFSRLKLATLSESLKKNILVVDEALSLLEMYSSSSVSKFTPKNTVCRGEFKVQLKEASMPAIPEEIELPEVMPAKRNRSDDAFKKTKDAVYDSANFKRKSNQQNLINTEQKTWKKSINESSKQIKIRNEMVSPAKKCEEFYNNTKKKKNSTRKGTKKATPQAIDNLSKENLRENSNITSQTMPFIDLNQAKARPENISEEFDHLDNSTQKDVQDKCDSLNFNSAQKHLLKDIKEKQEKNSEGENSSKPSRNDKKMTFELHEAIDNLNIEKSSLNESPKANLNKEQLLDSAKENPLHKGNEKPRVRKSALKNISSKINIENLKLEKLKLKSVCPLDDLLYESPKMYSDESQLFDVAKENQSNKDFKKPNVKKTAVKKISPKINIKKKLEKKKRKSVCPLDDLTTIAIAGTKRMKSICPLDDLTCPVMNRKEVVITRKFDKVLKNNKKSISRKKISNICLSDTDKLGTDFILQSDIVLNKKQDDLTLNKKEEMVKSLAKNTFLVTAEVHKIPSINSEICTKTDTLQPVVLLNDIFKASKSSCKSISSLPFDQADENSLEKQLLQHCSSLKIIADDSFNKNSISTDSGVGKSVDQDENSPKTVLHMEPPLLVDGEVSEEQINEDKKALRKRQSTICYKEFPVNTKLRRGNF